MARKKSEPVADKATTVANKATKKEITGKSDLKLQSAKAEKAKTTKSKPTAPVGVKKPELVHTAAEIVAARMSGYEAASTEARELLTKKNWEIDRLKDDLAEAVQDVIYLTSIINEYLNKGLVSKFAFAMSPSLFKNSLQNVTSLKKDA